MLHNLKGILNCSFISIFLLLLTFPTFAQEQNDRKELYGAEAAAVVPGANFVKTGNGTPVPAWVIFNEQNGIPYATFFSWLKDTYHLNSNLTFRKQGKTQEATLNGNLKYKVYFDNVQVDLNWLNLQVKNNKVYSFNGFIEVFKPLNTKPVLNEETALNYSLAFVDAQTYLWQIPMEEESLKDRLNNENATYFPEGKLVLVKIADNDVESHILTWRFDIREKNAELDQRIFINATTGEKVKSFPLNFKCNDGSASTTWYGTQTIKTDSIGVNMFILLDDCSGPQIRTTDTVGNNVVDANNIWNAAGQTGYATSHFHGRKTMDYFSAVHSRNSYDGNGGNIEIRHLKNTQNAFWSGMGLMRMGQNNVDANYYNTLDVIAHEFTHGVIDSSADLVYQGEPGALNESFCDIFGETTEMWYEGLSPNNYDWLHREDYFNGNNRSLIAPKDKGDPDTYMGDNWAPTNGGDNGGVHTNSGVQNHWFYLLSVGGSGTNDKLDDYSVNGLGVNKARTIAYENLTTQLGVNSDYDDAKTGAIVVATSLYGACSDEVKAVTNAWYAVGVGKEYINVSVTSFTNISCNGAADGSINITAVGTAPYVFLWGDGPATEDRTGLSPGTYMVTVTDATGCTDTISKTISQPDPLTISITDTSNYNGFNVSCNGGNDGWATATAAGGTTVYSYSWSDGQNTATASNLSAGSYTVVVTDANGCQDSTSITLNEPTPLTINAGPNQTVYFGYPPAECADIAWSGEGGGVPPYNISWSDAGSQAHEVCPGQFTTEYIVTITDLNGCEEKDTVTICVIDVRCGKNLNKVQICHVPPGNPSKSKTLCVGLNSVAIHLAKGDVLAECGIDHTCYDLNKTDHVAFRSNVNYETHLNVFPNPFNESTTVEFYAGTEGRVTIHLYDNIGRLVHLLFDGKVEPGEEYQVQIDASLFSAGIYECVLQHSDGSIMVQKIELKR